MDNTEVRVVDQITGGQKGQKLCRMDLIPVEPLQELAEHYGKGCVKYSARNWERGYAWSLSYAAAMRHLTQFWCGEDNDEETKTKHVICAAWHCLALAWFMRFKPEHDDRPATVRRQSDQQKSLQEPCQPPTGADDPCCLPSH